MNQDESLLTEEIIPLASSAFHRYVLLLYSDPWSFWAGIVCKDPAISVSLCHCEGKSFAFCVHALRNLTFARRKKGNTSDLNF